MGSCSFPAGVKAACVAVNDLDEDRYLGGELRPIIGSRYERVETVTDAWVFESPIGHFPCGVTAAYRSLKALVLTRVQAGKPYGSSVAVARGTLTP